MQLVGAAVSLERVHATAVGEEVGSQSRTSFPRASLEQIGSPTAADEPVVPGSAEARVHRHVVRLAGAAP